MWNGNGSQSLTTTTRENSIRAAVLVTSPTGLVDEL